MNYKIPAAVRCCQKVGLPPDKVLYVISDLLGLITAVAAAFLVRFLIGGFSIHQNTLATLILLFLCAPFIALSMGLYTSIQRMPPHRQLARLVGFVSVTFSCIFIVFFLLQTGHYYSRFVFLFGWLLSCFTVPLARRLTVRIFSRYPWWGLPLICLDRSSTSRRYWHFLRSHPENGLRPVAILDLPAELNDECHQQLHDLSREFPGAVAMLTGSPSDLNGELMAAINLHFSRILVMPVHKDDPADISSFLTTPYVLDATTGVFLQQCLHDKRRRRIKRLFDLFCCLCGSVVLVPLFALIALAIRLDSRGPVFYAQRRIGMGGKPIFVHKFRTMVVNADEIIGRCLAEHPELREEWESDRKLRNDPRITRVGRLLRTTSLDELPQIWDVLRGTMSLVGPRPIVEEERAKYGSVFNEYIRVLPGITGLWQISGRNDTSYTERVGYDFFYVANWSVWLDIWILFNTVPVVLFRRGAY